MIFYRAPGGVTGDVIPFFHNGRYHLFYLRGLRGEAAKTQGMPWRRVVTDDFLDFSDDIEVLAPGAPDDRDYFNYTGCVLKKGESFHIFYTGHNDRVKADGQSVEVIMQATSSDLRHWTKDHRVVLEAPAGYERHDWRDPFVFFNEEAGEYWMLLAARSEQGSRWTRGCVALAVSRDLVRWDMRDPFWAPELYFTHECPDLFRWGDWWYLVYSTFSERFVTHYRMSRTLQGPWLAPADDAFDTHSWYAAKTAGDGQRRFAFGWLATRSDKDSGRGEWGGDLVVHEIKQRPDGTLGAFPPPRLAEPFKHRLTPQPQSVIGDWHFSDALTWGGAPGRNAVLLLGEMPATCLLETELRFDEQAVAGGILLRADAELNQYYLVRIEPHRQRIVLARWPRLNCEAPYAMTAPFLVERSLRIEPGKPIPLRIFVDSTTLVVYAGDGVALSSRICDFKTGQWGLTAVEGRVEFRQPALRGV